MASIDRIAPDNIESYAPLIPNLFKSPDYDISNLVFYGIEEDGIASGVVIISPYSDAAEIRYIYILPELRGTGTMDEMLTMLFYMLKDEGFSLVKMEYMPKVYPNLKLICERYEFKEKELDHAYFKFTVDDIKKSKAATIMPHGVMRLNYLPLDKRTYLFKMVQRSMKLFDYKIEQRSGILPYSMVYMEGDIPKAALVMEKKSVQNTPLSDDIKTYPEPGAMDMALFFVGTGDQKAPLELLSALCKLVKTELADNTVLTGYFPEGHVTRLFEGIFGVRGERDVLATLDLRTF